ncbi:hypothetical protein VTI74DRAFT_242 [Chaetomium olivicolor]
MTPLPTPISTVVIPRGPFGAVGRRFENGTFTTSIRGPGRPDCSKFNGFQRCSSNGDYGSCLASTGAAFCNCNHGIQYLDCVSEAIATSSCAGAVGIGDWDAYERSWFQSLCPTPAASVMTMFSQPVSVSVELQTVDTVTLSGPITDPPRPVPSPTFREGGQLLGGDCKSTSYTLLDAGDLVYYAAFIGCNNARPQCCPWNVSTDAAPSNPGPGGQQGDKVAPEPGHFPGPADDAKEPLKRCPQDYYSVSGQCCPNGYYKFTRLVAFQTPCFSSLAGRAIPPPITAGLAANPTDSSVPTSAIVNIAFAMGFNVSGETSSGLSTGTKAGIGVGAGIGALIIVAAVAFFVLWWRRKRVGQQSGLEDQNQGMTYQPGYNVPQESPRRLTALTKPARLVPQGYGGSGDGNWGKVYGHSGGYQGANEWL